MAKLSKARQSEIKVEDLIRLKRSERPSDQFWNEFDYELHQRMLQTLVKKDPWYLQMMRGFSSRILSSTAIAAVIVAIVVVRLVFQPSLPTTVNVAQLPVLEIVSVPIEVARVELPISTEWVRSIGIPYYGTDAISVDEISNDANFTRDFRIESLQVASYDASAYAADMPQARVPFTSSGFR